MKHWLLVIVVWVALAASVWALPTMAVAVFAQPHYMDDAEISARMTEFHWGESDCHPWKLYPYSWDEVESEGSCGYRGKLYSLLWDQVTDNRSRAQGVFSFVGIIWLMIAIGIGATFPLWLREHTAAHREAARKLTARRQWELGQGGWIDGKYHYVQSTSTMQARTLQRRQG